MAKKQDKSDDSSSLLLAEELLDRGDPNFVDELRKVSDADRLGNFAARWYGDQRPTSRQFLLEYLKRPLNSYRHEALVKRLFKLADSTGDDVLMAHFAVALDRSVRRRIGKRHHHEKRGNKWESWEEEWLHVPTGTKMPRGTEVKLRNPRTGEWLYFTDTSVGKFSKKKRRGETGPEELHKKLEDFRLFTVHTRNYLRRRVWRYFRRLGKEHPERYLPATLTALKMYTDDDVHNGVALLDNWSMMHFLFHGCPALLARSHGWTVADGHTLAELAPAPMFEDLWKAAPKALLELLKEAQSRPVRQWTIRLLQRDHGAVLAGLSLDELLALLGHSDEDVVNLAAGIIRNAPGLDTLPVDRWLVLLETPNAAVLDVLCDLIGQHVKPERATLDEAVRLTASRPLPVARLGLSWLQSKAPATEAECKALLGLVDAACEPLRAEIVRWARGVLSASPHFQPEWVLEYLDSKHAEVREEGWTWFQGESRARDQVELWRKLMESPYDDVRFHLIADLEERVRKGDPNLSDESKLDPELLQLLWATVLLNIHRGNRIKPIALQQMVKRVIRRPKEAPLLLPIVSVALRSVRGPEWRAGLAGVVQMIERNPELEPTVRAAFPELKWV